MGGKDFEESSSFAHFNRYHILSSLFSDFPPDDKITLWKETSCKRRSKTKILAIDEFALIKNYSLLKKSLSVLGMVVLGFCIPRTPLRACSNCYSRRCYSAHHILKNWNCLLYSFFIGLFITRRRPAIQNKVGQFHRETR